MSAERIDWSQLWHPGPTRVFTADELARAGADRPSRTLVTMVLLNLALLAFMLLQAAPPRATALLTGLLAAGTLLALRLAQRVWRDPTRARLTRYTLVLCLAAGGVAALLRLRHDDDLVWTWAFLTCWGVAFLGTIGLLFVSLYRADQIAARLREQDERQRAVDMARQLATAQVQPHFLFNSLASLQHWVQSKDDRAALLLDALMAFLRTTLPLFDRPRLRLGEEAEVVRHYFEVMQLRLGSRLRWRIEVDPAAAEVMLPPGLLLTLVENAIEHGVGRSLAGAEVALAARVSAGRLQVDVQDSGPGPQTGLAEGVGLANARKRLVQAFGAAASLTLCGAAAGGALARIECPVSTTLP